MYLSIIGTPEILIFTIGCAVLIILYYLVKGIIEFIREVQE